MNQSPLDSIPICFNLFPNFPSRNFEKKFFSARPASSQFSFPASLDDSGSEVSSLSFDIQDLGDSNEDVGLGKEPLRSITGEYILRRTVLDHLSLCDEMKWEWEVGFERADEFLPELADNLSSSNRGMMILSIPIQLLLEPGGGTKWEEIPRIAHLSTFIGSPRHPPRLLKFQYHFIANYLLTHIDTRSSA